MESPESFFKEREIEKLREMAEMQRRKLCGDRKWVIVVKMLPEKTEKIKPRPDQRLEKVNKKLSSRASRGHSHE